MLHAVRCGRGVSYFSTCKCDAQDTILNMMAGAKRQRYCLAGGADGCGSSYWLRRERGRKPLL